MSSSINDTSTRNRSDSVEGSGLPEHEHKRPRLSESQSDATHVMSDLQQSDSKSATSLPAQPGTEAKDAGSLRTPPLPPQPLVTAMSPTSKVTINTRPLSSQSVTKSAAGTANDLGPGHDLDPDHNHAPENNHTDADLSEGVTAGGGDGTHESKHPPTPPPEPRDPPETISISSSPSKSPEIEIAEVEDFDQDPAQTRWTSRIGGSEPTDLAGSRSIHPHHVYHTFPYGTEVPPGETQQVIESIAERFSTAESNDGDLFRQVTDWLVEFVSLCDEFPARLIEEDRDFWLRLPVLVESLLRRNMGPPSHARSDDLVNFFVAYAHITKLLMDYDVRTLQTLPEDMDSRSLKTLTLTCEPYLLPLSWALQSRITLYESLRRSYNFDVAQFLTLVIDRIGNPTSVALLPSISSLLSETCLILPKKPEMFKTLTSLLAITSHVMGPMFPGVNSHIDFDITAFSQLDGIREHASHIIRKADAAFQQAIVKQSPWLNLENAPKAVDTLNALVTAIAIEVPQIGQDIISSAGVGFADADLTDLPVTMPYAWKFKTLRKFITNGRMELRVYGVEIMSSDLVQVYKEHITQGPKAAAKTHPLVRFLVKFIEENQLVSYIVGVDSHPQLIRRAYNILGFLCVSGSYTDAHTDKIWDTIVESQDPRTVREVFNMLQLCFYVYELPEFEYICQKLLDYPFQRYDQHVLHFTVAIFDSLRTPGGMPPLEHISIPITRTLCIRLLRDASMSEHVLSDHAAFIRRDLPQQLTVVLALGRGEPAMATIADDERDRIITEAAANLEAHSSQSSGDLQVLNRLLPMLGRVTSAQMVTLHNLPSLLVADFADLRRRCGTAAAQSKATDLAIFEVWYEIRASLLQYFIISVPEAFSAEHVDTLWTSFFTANDLSPRVRSRAWETLTHVVRHKQAEENPFIDAIIDTHLPSLKPGDYSESLLDFLKMSVSYTIRQSAPGPPGTGGDIVVIPGIERIWKVMLEAPPNTVENEATEFIMRQYLDHHLVTQNSKSVIEATHSALVDRCVAQVTASASKLKSFSETPLNGDDDHMIIIASEDEIRAEELRFDRSLLFLRKFLEGMKSRPRYSPAPTQYVHELPVFPGMQGETVGIRVQIFNSKYVNSEMRTVTVGAGNTLDELGTYLSEISGFTQLTAFHFGRKLPLAAQPTQVGDSKLTTGLLMIQKTANTPETVPSHSTRAASPVDSKIMHHFGQLYDLLDSDERLSREVYNFLSLFTAQTELVRTVRSMERAPAELLPPGRPFKLLYRARTLQSCIEDESFNSNPDPQFLIYSVRTIVEILPELDMSDTEDLLQVTIAQSLVEALLLALRAKASAETSREYIQDHREFTSQISRLMIFASTIDSTITDIQTASVMIKLILETFIETCLHDDRVWNYVNTEQIAELIMAAFVEEPRAVVRRTLPEVVVGLTGAAGTKINLKVNDPRAARSRFSEAAIETCLNHLWTALAALVPRACEHACQCADVFETMFAMLKKIGKSFSLAKTRQHFDQWSSLLIHHENIEVVGQPLTDHVVEGLTRILLESGKLLQNADSLPPSTRIIDDVITKFLFPPLSDTRVVTEKTAKSPILDGIVRETLYNLILLLTQGSRDVATIVSRLTDDLLPKDFFEPVCGHERQSLRSDVGYSGLRNLSNTCYLNSLFSQLFMNVEFRALFLNIPYPKDSKSQLVLEVAKVFAHMQNSFEKSIDPSGAVEAITTYEGEQIDVAVQMDVDEFFNLLFDRLEGQIDPKQRGAFKSIYGGQLVQQVKSKECEHISERLEPFSAVQVEIRGKAGLEESLRAYVEGEVLQGENKYSCTSCGRHVDAVKRACLKDVPNNLIFNLKRFDYDIMTGMRAKVNDEFQFPDTLDVAPYTLARLSDDGEPQEPDYFKLVGVIVHSGTADSGHYYSFIRQRPSAKSVKDSWIQFNDQDVSVFDPGQMRDSCFGGVSESGIYHLPKFYSAYMLFYQRASNLEQVERQYLQHDLMNPVRIPLSPSMEQHIALQNELFLRSYCVQDSSHAKFVRRLLEKTVPDARECSELHTLENHMIEMTLEYIRQISSRWKECPSVEDTIGVLVKCSERCAECTRAIVEWFTKPRVLEDVIVRSPYQVVRKAFANLFSRAFTRLHSLKTEPDPKVEDYAQLCIVYRRCVGRSIAHLGHLWEVVTRNGRCWVEYFGVLSNIARLGDDEIATLLDHGFLECCLDMIMIHLNNPADFPISKTRRIRYGAYLAARDKNRQFNHSVVVRFFVAMMLRIDLHLVLNGNQRICEAKVGLVYAEGEALGLMKVPYELEWLRRLLAGRYHPNAIDSLVEELAADRKLVGPLATVLVNGLNHRNVGTAASFLRPALIFCQTCPSENQIFDLVEPALESIATSGFEYGKEYFEFLQGLLELENPSVGGEEGFLQDLVVQSVAHWAPTFLLTPFEGHPNIRQVTTDILRRILFIPLEESLDQNTPRCAQLRGYCFDLACTAQAFVHGTFLNPKSRDVSTLQPGQASALLDVVELCLTCLENGETPEREEKVAEIRDTMAALANKAEAALESLSSVDWHDNSSDMAEISADEYDDPSSPAEMA